MEKQIKKIFEESIKVKKDFLDQHIKDIVEGVNSCIKVFKNDGKIFLFGNGGSAADSQHIAAEFVGRFKKNRRALPAIALTTDTSILTAIGNDYGFDVIFLRQIEALSTRKDLACGLSTSGNSKNVIAGIKQAKKMGLRTISLTGCGGGALAKLTDISYVVPSHNTARIQETHICIAHAICELVEQQLTTRRP